MEGRVSAEGEGLQGLFAPGLGEFSAVFTVLPTTILPRLRIPNTRAASSLTILEVQVKTLKPDLPHPSSCFFPVKLSQGHFGQGSLLEAISLDYLFPCCCSNFYPERLWICSKITRVPVIIQFPLMPASYTPWSLDQNEETDVILLTEPVP